MDLVNAVLNFVVPPASMIIVAFAWPTISFLHALEWFFKTLYRENMENKVVLIPGASSAIGEQLAYEYARRKANLVLVARRENRLWGIKENARLLGAKHVLVMAADVVKEEECRRFISDTIMHHLVNTASLGHNFYFEEATDPAVFPHMMNYCGKSDPSRRRDDDFWRPRLLESRSPPSRQPLPGVHRKPNEAFHRATMIVLFMIRTEVETNGCGSLRELFPSSCGRVDCGQQVNGIAKLWSV
ncbi:hypothetical protein MUK42_33939 [Musa troglodytarum]|uniref:Uncharacterized protein n=1 Tax=Musa troglodytarum TaxID=320322 RepID=A0A9E7KJW1_9LILI|nr:hypothetical protein MUK42_33939 [Musa troglodytarum]